MKAIFTILLTVFLSYSGYSQSFSVSKAKTGATTSGNNIASPSLTISKIYPNPVKNIANVELQSSESGNVQVFVFNILGNEVKRWDQFYISQGEQKLQLDLSFLKSGVYILKISKSDQVAAQVLRKN